MQASKQASKHASEKASKASEQVSRQGSSQAQKHLEGIQSEPCPGGACNIHFLVQCNHDMLCKGNFLISKEALCQNIQKIFD